MKTYILEWAPAASPMTEEEFLKAMRCLEWGDFSFGFREEVSARSGDNFYIVRIGTDKDGIVGKGFFLSDPYEDSGKEYACRISARPTFMVSWECPKGLITLEELKAVITDFPWGQGLRCQELLLKKAVTLSGMWESYISRFDEEDFDNGMVERTERPVAGIDEAVAIASEALFDRKDKDGKPAILHSLASGLAGQTEDEMICGFLQSVLDNPEWTPGKIREKGFPERIIDTLSINCHHY